jgi:L-lactate dehydrogenase complex protein LldG
VRESLGRGTRTEAPPPYRPPAPPPADELTARLVHELAAVGGVVHRAASRAAAREAIVGILVERKTRRVVLGATDLLRELELDGALASAGVDVVVADLAGEAERGALREAAFAADAGVTSADFGVADTGTLALLARRGQGRALSLLPPLHVAVLDARDVVGELAELFERVRERGELPSALTLITGPSRTGDIELVLTVGVHGPGELHVVVIDAATHGDR